PRPARRTRDPPRRAAPADRVADLAQAPEHPPPLGWRRLRDKRDSPAPFASEPHGLQQPQHDKQDWRQDAYLLIRGSRPTRKVPKPISSMDNTSIDLRPTRSPK